MYVAPGQINAQAVSEECSHHKILLPVNIGLMKLKFLYITFLTWLIDFIVCGRERVPFSLVLNEIFISG